MALFFAAGHLLYAAALYTAKNDPVKVERIETPRQAAPFALDILLVLGVYFTGLLAHFGRTGARFTWEKTDKAEALKKAAEAV